MLLAILLLVRALNSFLINTTFAPDEWWQGPEVAHRMVFGYGHLTWEWAVGLRSYAHPSLYAVPYWMLRALRADSAWAVVRAPQLVHAVFAAGTDFFVVKTSRLLFGSSTSGWALACQLAAWFNAYALVRTYSNSLEACFTAAGVYFWLRGRLPARQTTASAKQGACCSCQSLWLLMAALCTVFRPSSALFWLLPAILELHRQLDLAARLQLLAQGVGIGSACLASASLLDRWLHGRWVVAPWEFFKFNLLSGSSALYGTHPWHWNLTQGLPVVAFTLLPLLLVGLRKQQPGRRDLAWLLAWQLLITSLPAHKEFRFLLPALQLAMPFCSAGAASLAAGGNGSSSSSQASRGGSKARSGQPAWLCRLPAACLAAQLPAALYFCLLHHRGNVEVMHAIRQLAASSPAPASVLFLTPCHATPYYTHVHAPLPMRFLDCSPPGWAPAVEQLNRDELAWLRLPQGCAAAKGAGAAGSPQLTQRRCFELDPEAYLAELLAANAGQHPSVLVGYGDVMQRVAGVLAAHSYQRERSWHNCLVQTDPDTPCGIELWVREESLT